MFKIVTIPFNREAQEFNEELLNKIVLNKQIKGYKAEFFQDGGEKYWTVFIEYDPVLEKASKKDTLKLTEPQKLLFERLRHWRKERAEKEGIPVFLVGTNKELAEIAGVAPKNLEALRDVKGFGKAKISKYGKEIIDIIKAFYEES